MKFRCVHNTITVANEFNEYHFFLLGYFPPNQSLHRTLAGR